MILLLGLALSLGAPPVPTVAVADQACTSNITITQITVTNSVPNQAYPDVVHDAFQIRGYVSSACQVQTVVAEAFGHSISLVKQPVTPGFPQVWQGDMSIASDPHTPFTLTVTATDINGTPAVGTRDLIHDLPPVLTITTPVPNAVARPSLQVTMSCADDYAAGCTSVRMFAPLAPGSPTLATGVSGINESVSLAAFEGQRLLVRFEGWDSRNQAIVSGDRYVFIESSPYLVEVANAPGTILDDSDARTLFLANELHPTVREKSSGDIVQLSTSTQMPAMGRVTPHGALAHARPTTSGSWNVVELFDGVVTTRGSLPLQVKGNYALVGPALVGDLDAGTWETISPPDYSGFGGSIGPNKDFVYSKVVGTSQIFRYRDGIDTQLTFGGVSSVSPDTDGVNVAYKQVDSNGNTVALRLVTSGGDVLLADFTGQTSYPATPQRDYLTNGGWTAFTKRLANVINVWRRAPDGTISQASFFGSNSTIDALNSDGSVTVINQNRLWLVTPSGGLQPVSQWQYTGTRSFFRDGDLHVIIGASAFEVSPAPDQACPSNFVISPIQINAPQYQPNVVGHTFPIRTTISSACQIQTVVAEAFGHSFPLAYDQPSGNWGGIISLAGDPHGPFTLTVTATDINGTQGVRTRDLIHDLPPTLNIVSPVHSAVARPSLQVNISCVDDDPAGCASVTMTAPIAPGMPMLASGVSGINQTLSLAGYEGVGVWVRIVAIDSVGQAVVSERFVFVESSPLLVEVANAPGAILDDSPDRTLFLAEDIHPSVREKSGGQIFQLATSAYRISDGRVTNHGALAETKLTPPVFFTGWTVVELRDGVVTTVANTTGLQVKGNYALVSTSLFGDLDAGTWATVPVSNPVGGSVGPNGDFVYSTLTPRQIFRYRGGGATQLTFSGGVHSVSPDTDGVDVAYKQVNDSGHTLALRLITDGGDVLLADFAGYNNHLASPGRDYVTNGGWTAFTKPVGGVINVWRRAPDGTSSQVSSFGSNATIDALSSDGAISIKSQFRYWLAPAGGGPLVDVSQRHDDFSTPAGGHIGTRTFFRDGDLYVLLGASVFKVVGPPTITAQPSNQTAASGQTATFSVTVSGTGPFTYQWYTGTSGTTTNPIAGATSSSYTTPPLTSPTRVWVRVSNLSGSVDSAHAVVIMPFTDDPLLPGVTMIKAVHVAELRARIDAVRAKYALGVFAYSQPSITAGVSLVLAQTILELRAALAQAYTAAGQTPPSYVTSPAGGMPILAVDFASLRSAIVAIE